MSAFVILIYVFFILIFILSIFDLAFFFFVLIISPSINKLITIVSQV